MQTYLGLIFILIGLTGMAVYLSRGALISADEKIALLLAFFMILIGVIIIYNAWKRKDRDEKKH